MSKYGSEREERLLQQLLDRYQSLGIIVWGEIEGAPGTYAKILVKSDGTVKVEGVATISGDVDVSNRWARQLGQVDIARYLGSAMGVLNPLHGQFVYGGVVIDPRSIRALVKTTDEVYAVFRTDAGVAYDARDRNWTISETLTVQATDLDIRNLVKTQDEVYSVLRTDAGVVYDARDRSWNLGASDVPDLSDRPPRLVGRVYGSQGAQLLQRATTLESVVQLSHQGSEYDARQIRALTSSDVVDVSNDWARQLGLIDVSRVLGAALSASNPLIAGIYDQWGNRMPSMDAVSRRGFITVTDGVNSMPTMDTAGRSGVIRITDGTEILSIDTSNRAEVTPYQATRSNLNVKSERDSGRTVLGGTYSPSGAGIQIITPSGSLTPKVYSASYEGLTANAHTYLYFGTTTTTTARRFMVRNTAGPIAQSFPHPICGNAGDGIYIYSSLAQSSMPVALDYVLE